MSSRIEHELTQLLGEAAMAALVETFGGTRLYVAPRPKDDCALVIAIGRDAAMKLAEVYSPDQILIPLAREFRARHYRAQGLTNTRIAVALGMTVKGIESLFRRMKRRGEDLPQPARRVGEIVGSERERRRMIQ